MTNGHGWGKPKGGNEVDREGISTQRDKLETVAIADQNQFEFVVLLPWQM